VIRLLAIFFFALAVIFEAWSISHGAWTWHLLVLLGLLAWCLSSAWDHAPW
jgi:hypothetical protein